MAKTSKVITGKIRFSYADNMYNAKANDKGVMKYSVTLLIPKSDKDTYKNLCDAAENVKRTKFPGKDPVFYTTPPKTIHDGDGTNNSGEPYGAECKGCWVISVSSNDKPGIVDENLQPMMEKIVSGDYGRVSLNAYWFDSGTNKGVTFGLNNVQFIEGGKRIDGRTSAVDDFAAF